MNENTENSGNDFFYDLLDNPADLSHSNAFNLQLLINDYPQSSLLRSMLAVKREEESIRSASAYVNSKLLYKIANSVNSLREVTDEQIAFAEQPKSGVIVRSTTGTVDVPNVAVDESNYFHVPIDNDLAYFEDEETEELVVDEHPESEEITETVVDFENTQEEELPPPVPAETSEAAELPDEDIEAVETESEPEEETENEAAQDEVASEEVLLEEEQTEENEADIAEPEAEDAVPVEVNEDAEANLTREYDEYMSRSDEASALNDIGEKPVHPHQEIEDDVFEEIVSIEDIGLEQLAIMGKVADDSEAIEEQEQTTAEKEQEADLEHSYEVFEPTLPEDEEPRITPNIIPQNASSRKAGERVARYNDEKMPYSFMWWLDKTRKEHAEIYQPFIEGKAKAAPAVPPAPKPQPPADHLQQQYMENILTVTTVVNELNLTPPKVDTPPPVDAKADKIIERFIQEEPQIKHPAKAKLDNENKAKKSSEDRDELVTETLAKIYTEQMLYHKAILTYKKLMLKFPEKSLYFAGQIEQLEKKIN